MRDAATSAVLAMSRASLQLALLVSLALGLAQCGGTTAHPSSDRVDDLPRLLVVYSYTCAHRPSFTSWFENSSADPVHQSLSRLDNALQQLPGDLATRMAFTKGAYILPIGAVLEVPGDPSDSMLFVVPIGQDRSLLVLSSNSPRRTSIVEVDDRFEARLLYDSFEFYRDTGGEAIVLGALARIAVVSAHCLRLESVPRGEEPRTVELTMSSSGIRFASCADH